MPRCFSVFHHRRSLCSWGLILLLLVGQFAPVVPVQAITQTGGPVLVSVSSDGTLGDGDSFAPSFSADGRFVAFASDATNLVANDTNGARDIFVLDRDADEDGVYDEDEPGAVKIVRVSISSGGEQATPPSGQPTYMAYSDDPSISADGRFIAFRSGAGNLVSGDTNNDWDIFVHDRDADENGIYDEPGAISTFRVNVSSDGVQSSGWLRSPVISGNGRYVAFVSDADNLVPGDTNNRSDVFLHDIQTRTTERVSVADAAYDFAEGNGESSSPSISFDGRYIAFASGATNLVGGDTNWSSDVFVRDRQAGTTERVSVSSAVYGSVEGNRNSAHPAISPDGRYVAFTSGATNLVPDVTGGFAQVYLHDRQTHSTLLVSRSPATGEPGDGSSWEPSVATGPSGQVAVAFTSQATNLVEENTNAFWNVFLALFLGATPVNDPPIESEEIARIGGAEGPTDGPKVMWNPDGVSMVYSSMASLVTADTNGKTDVYVSTFDGGGETDDGGGTPPSTPPAPQVSWYLGAFEPSQGVWQDDYSFADKEGKRLVIDYDQHKVTAELPMVLGRPTLLFGTRGLGSTDPANDPRRNTIKIYGGTYGSVAVPVKFKFTLKQNGIEKIIYISPPADKKVFLDGQPGPLEEFEVSIDASNGIPPEPDGAFKFLMPGPYTIDAELIREDGEPTGIKVTLEGQVVETRGPRTYFQPIFVPGDNPNDDALANSLTQRAADLAAESAQYVPDFLPLKPGGLPTFPRGVRDMRAAIEEKQSGIVNTVVGWFGLGPSPEDAMRAAMNDLLTSGAVLQRAGRVVTLLSDAGMDVAGFDGASAFTSSQKLIFVRPDRTYTTVAHELVHTMPFLWSSEQMLADGGLDYHNDHTITVAHGHRITVGGAESRARQANKLSLMGPTASDKWIDQCTYWHMVKQLQSPPDPDLVLVRGLLGRDGAEVRGALFPAYQMTGVADLEAGAGGDYAIVLRDNGGAELGRYPFTPQWNLAIELDEGADPNEADVAQNLIAFAYRVPDVPDAPGIARIARIDLTGPGDTVLDSVYYSAHAPAVTITAPAEGGTVSRSVYGTVYAEWTGTDADGDSLLYSVFYSPDGGETWFDQAFEQAATALEVPVSEGDSAPMLKVIVTDGARSGEAAVSFSLPQQTAGGSGGGGSSGSSVSGGGGSSGSSGSAAATFDPARDTVIRAGDGAFNLAIPAGAIETSAGSSVKVSVTDIAKSEADKIIQSAKAPEGVKAIGRVFEFKAEATSGGATQTITTFAKPVTFTVALSADDLKGVTDPEKVGLFRLNDDGTLTFVGGKLVDGKLVVKLYGFSKYVLAEVNVAFTDLAGHWAKGDVELMASKYVAKGLPDGRFDPAGQVTRAQFAAMLVRAMGLPAAPASTTFADVKTGDWFYAEVMTAVQAGIVNGMGDGTFRPGDPVTREQAAAMVARALKAAGRQAPDQAQAAELLASFADAAAVSGWAVVDLALAVQEGIVRGQTATAIAPAAGATRAEAAVMIARFWRKS